MSKTSTSRGGVWPRSAQWVWTRSRVVSPTGPEPMDGAEEDALVGGHETDDMAAPTLLESVDAVERVALRGRLEALHVGRSAVRAGLSSELQPAARVRDTEVVPRPCAALLGPADGL